MTRCPCGAEIRWGTNPKTDKRQPFNAEPDPTGNRTLDQFGTIYVYKTGDPIPEGHTGPYRPHHADCPRVRQFRR